VEQCHLLTAVVYSAFMHQQHRFHGYYVQVKRDVQVNACACTSDLQAMLEIYSDLRAAG